MSVEPVPIEIGSLPGRLLAPPGRRFLTNPEVDPLGLAAEIYYARTGRIDYDDQLAKQENPRVVTGRAGDTKGHPFLNCYAEQNRYNALVDEIRTGSPTPELYLNCRHRWHLRAHSATPETHNCMRIFCPACWMLKVEKGYGALADAQAPVLGVIATDPMGVGPTWSECLTEKGRQTLVAPMERLGAHARDACWHPLFWALFPVVGASLPAYRFVGIFVASKVLDRKPEWARTPSELAELGVPRRIETTTGNVTAWEQTFSGEHRADDAWRAFRRLTPCPVITSSEDGSTPNFTDGDAILSEPRTILLKQTNRLHLKNQTRYASLAGDISHIGEVKPNLDDLETIYEDIRMAYQANLDHIAGSRKAAEFAAKLMAEHASRPGNLTGDEKQEARE